MSSGGDRDASVYEGSQRARRRSVAFELGNRHAERGEMDRGRGGLPPRRRGGARYRRSVRRLVRGGPRRLRRGAGRVQPSRRARRRVRRAASGTSVGGARRLGRGQGRLRARGRARPRTTPVRPQEPAPQARRRARTQPAAVADGRPAFANPVLIGAVTVLIAIIAVFLAYNANTGLPFVPTRELKVDIANGSNLVVGNDVRSGGFRIGVVNDMKPIALPSGQTGAQLMLHLDQTHSRVPVDSTATILPSSVLGTKYVDLHTGTSSSARSPTVGCCRWVRRMCRCSSTTCSRRLTQDAGRGAGQPHRCRRCVDGAGVGVERHDLEPAAAAFASAAGREVPV